MCVGMGGVHCMEGYILRYTSMLCTAYDASSALCVLACLLTLVGAIFTGTSYDVVEELP